MTLFRSRMLNRLEDADAVKKALAKGGGQPGSMLLFLTQKKGLL